MDRWNSRGGKSQRREEKRREEKRREEKRREEKRRANKKQEDQRRKRLRRKTMQVRDKVEKSRFTLFFQWCVAPEGRKVGSLKRRVRSHLARWEMKNCMPLWRKAHYELKVYKIRQLRTLLGIEMWKKCTLLWRESHFEVKSVKNWRFRTTFGSWDVEKVHAAVARSTFPSQNVLSTADSEHFLMLRCRKRARRTFPSQKC